MSQSSAQTKTIHEFLAENPDVDNTELWTTFWEILSAAKDRIVAELPVAAHPSSAGLEYWKTEDGNYEGSMSTFAGDLTGEGPAAEWLVHSWIGNRKNSILDMNLQVWLGPQIDVPHLIVVFGTIPQVFFYSECVARKDLMVDIDHLTRYYEPENDKFLALRGDDRFTWSVSHGPYMRAFLSPIAHSYMADRTDDVIETLRAVVNDRVDTWLGWVRDAVATPLEERAALRQRDHAVRTHGYTLDPMNELSKKFLGAARVDELVAVRAGFEQMEEPA